jgi:lipooligosaccharide transport system permease protein
MLGALPLFGVVPSVWTLFLVPVLFLEGILFAALGLIMTALARNYEFFNYFTSLFITPLFLFSGIFFPLDSLSSGVRNFMLVLPLTPAVTISRMLCHGRPDAGWPLHLTVITLFSLASAAVAAVLLRRRLIQ